MADIDFRKSKAYIMSDVQKISDRYEKGYQEAKRVSEIVENTESVLSNLDCEFCKKTGLTETDIILLFLATGLQIVRQYLVTKFPERQDNQTAANQIKGHSVEHSNRTHRLYNPSLEEIITNPVPFDANIGANGALSGGGSLGHRVTAIGHDPLLGLVFGTANIATSTLTTNTFMSYHIYTNESNRDCFKSAARTDLVISKTINKMLYEGIEGKTIVGASFIKEIIHLKSDLYTKHSLPMPVVSVIDAKTSSTLASYGLDMANAVTVGKQATYTLLINSLIAMIHFLLYDGDYSELDKKLYEVRTRKILSYSNLIATSSNLAVVAITQKFDLLDLGGLAVSVFRLISDKKFIEKIKHEFIFDTYDKMIVGDYLT